MTLISFAVFTGCFFTKIPKVHIWIYVLTFGALGCFLSASFRRSRLTFNTDFEKNVYVFFGVERVIISMVCAVIIAFAIKSKLIFGENTSFHFLMFASTLAGFSETLIPNIFQKFDKVDS